MKLLLLHTAGVEGSVAIADTARAQAIVSSEVLPGRSSSERLVPAVRRLLAAAGWRLAELAAIAVVHGPGSFTGVRVGLSAAKGLSEAAGVPLVAVSRLALLADCAGDAAANVFAVLDAGRGEFYLGEYAAGHCLREVLLSGEEVVTTAADDHAVVVCEGKVADALAAANPLLVDEPSAAAALPLALARIAAGQFDDAALLDANYLRRTDLEIFAKQKASAE